MAIIFLRNKNKESRWYFILALAAVGAMLALSISAFWEPGQNPAQNNAVNLIDASIADSDFVKNLEPFPAVSLEGVKRGRSEPFLIYYQQPAQP